ncbi:MAG: hypothetical protein PHI90_09465, partial [Clostridia bacterium]|nr:hypothetical protein [Clostridia bacterium]
TPYIFNYGEIKFIPIEAVAVAIQCKSKDLKPEGIKSWVDSIKKLKTSLNSVARIMTSVVDNNLEKAYVAYSEAKEKDEYKYIKTQTSTRPIMILCSMKKEGIGDGIVDLFDITLNIEEKNTKKEYITEKESRLTKKISDKCKNYMDWYKELNHYGLKRFGYDMGKYKTLMNTGFSIDKELDELEVKGADGEEIVIMSLIFQLNQMIMLINNPMLFPHEAYVKMFNGTISKNSDKTAK